MKTDRDRDGRDRDRKTERVFLFAGYSVTLSFCFIDTSE